MHFGSGFYLKDNLHEKLPSDERHKTQMKKRILSIDGGGIKGVFPASFLSSIEEVVDGKVADYFDLIVGTSTGGIIALGLGLGFSAKEILEFYEKYGAGIFKGNRFFKVFRHAALAKYNNTALKKALEETFGDRKLGESLTRLAIPSFNIETGEVHIYKTAHNERFVRDYSEPVVSVALATSAAPTFFPTHTTSAGQPLIDGGVWANNPIGLAVVEAVGVLGWKKDEIEVLSVGCTTESLDVRRGRTIGLGWLYWGPKLADIFMASQSSASAGTASVLIGHENIHRISPNVANGKFGLDVTKEINYLKGLGVSEARKQFPLIQDLFSEKVERFVPNRSV